MKLIIPTFERMEWMPPTVTLFRELVRLGHEIDYITLFPDSFFQNEAGIHNVPLCRKERNLESKIPYTRGVSGLLKRLDDSFKKWIAHTRLKPALRRLLTPDARLWVVNEMTVMLAGSSFLRDRHYLFTVYELHEDQFYARHIKKAAQGADRVIVPEYCRAHIMKARYHLKKLPLVLPNKSPIRLEGVPTDAAMQASINELDRLSDEGRITVLYMGGISRERALEPLLNAIASSPVYRLAVIGRENAYLHELQEKYPDGFTYLGGFVNPRHLAVAAHAKIGLLFYQPTGVRVALNALFCAPNKIFEYCGLGLPVIANDIPGLRFEVVPNGIGKVTDFESPQDVIGCLDELAKHYAEYHARALAYYQSVDIPARIRSILE